MKGGRVAMNSASAMPVKAIEDAISENVVPALVWLTAGSNQQPRKSDQRPDKNSTRAHAISPIIPQLRSPR